MKLHPSIQSLIDEVDAFCMESGINPTAFGLRAVNDGKLLSDIRSGRMPSLNTIDRIRAFMANRKKASAA